MNSKTIKPEQTEINLRICIRIISYFCIWLAFKAGLSFAPSYEYFNIIREYYLITLICSFGTAILFEILSFHFISYTMEERKIVSRSGIFWKSVVNIPYKKITNIDTEQGPLQRIFGIGNISIQTAGSGESIGEASLVGLKNFSELKDEMLEISEKSLESTSEETEQLIQEQILAELKKISASLKH